MPVVDLRGLLVVLAVAFCTWLMSLYKRDVSIVLMRVSGVPLLEKDIGEGRLLGS
jgi:hypothetical protein